MTDTVEPSGATGRRRRLIAVLASMLVLVAAGLVMTRVVGVWGDSGTEAQPSASPSSTGQPSPFAGTPAENFAEGEAGIELPPAEPVGDFTADQVEEALERVREALIAARLDPSMLVEHDPDGFLATLASDHQSGRGEQFDSGEFATYATQVTDDAALAPVEPRVDGQISFDVAEVQRDDQLIEVTTRFVWVYAFEASSASPASDLVVVRDDLLWRIRGEPWLESSQGLWLHSETARAWGADCDSLEEGLVRPDPEPVAGLIERADVIFDPAQPLDVAGSC